MGEFHIARDGKTYDVNKAIVDCYDPTNHLFQTGVTLEGDIEIGAVELKDATSTARAVVKSDGTNNALVVIQNTVPTTTVQSTNLDIRDLVSTSDSVEVKQSTASNLNANVSATHLDIRHLNTTDDAVNVGTVTTLTGITNTVVVSSTNLDVRDLTSTSDSVSTVVKAVSGRPVSFEDAGFLVGDSPATLDVNAALGRNGLDGYVVNDGNGNFTVAISNNGTNYSSEITLRKGDVMSLTNLDVDTIRITWVADSSYRAVVI